MKKASNKKNNLLFTFLFLGMALFFPIITNAQSTTASTTASTTPKKPFIFVKNPLFNLQVKIPGLEKMASETPATCEVTGDQTSCSLPWISIYVKAIYNYSMGIVGILAALAMMIGGVIYLTSAGNASRISEAKSWIGGALTGMLIMFTAYILLNEVNPDLIGFKPIKLNIVQEMTLSDAQENIDAAAAANPSFTPANVKENAKVKNVSQCSSMAECDNSGAGFIDAKKVPEITKNIVIPSNVDARLLPKTIEGLKKASSRAAAKGVKLYITDALRSQKLQCKYWFSWGQDPAKASRPGSCNSHMGGTTVDIKINGVDMTKGGYVGANSFEARNSNTKLLYDIMIGAGWIRYCGEYWHFSYGDSMSTPCPGKGGHCSEYSRAKGVYQVTPCTN